MTRPSEFIRSVKIELSQVRWPSHEETMRMTVMVIIASIAVAVYSGGLDYLFTSVLQQVISR